MEIKFTNSMTGKKETFVPKEKGKVSMYSCGPTVWGLIHIGNLRAAMTSDLIYRTLQKLGFEVTYVRNYTDVDDKIIKRAQEEGVNASEIAKKYIEEVEKDYALAGLLEPTHKTTVSGHIQEIIRMIQKIIEHQSAYITSEGEVFFSVSSFERYGKLSGKKTEDLMAGARVEVNAKKKDPADFSLWKPAKPGEPFWESPWGRGRPGWHIECSAMASKWLGEELDIHHGGSDLIFPHHENEIAQSESASGHHPYVRYWLHNAMLNINAEKMSKSLGNVISARDFLSRYGAEVTRMMILSVHYRSIADFSEESIRSAVQALRRIYEAKQTAEKLLSVRGRLSEQRTESIWGEFMADCQKCEFDIKKHMANDFNTPGALASVFTLIRNFNRTISEPQIRNCAYAVLGSQEVIRLLESDLDGFLGIGKSNSSEMLQKLIELDHELRGEQQEGGPTRLTPEEIQKQIDARNKAKKDRKYHEADQIRSTLESQGVLLKDTPHGTEWSYK